MASRHRRLDVEHRTRNFEPKTENPFGSLALPNLLLIEPFVPIFLSPDVRRCGGNVFLDDIPDGGGDNQRHQFCAPIFDEKTLNRGFHGDHLDGLRLDFAIGLIAFEK
jgi:hypothetical protein